MGISNKNAEKYFYSSGGITYKNTTGVTEEVSNLEQAPTANTSEIESMDLSAETINNHENNLLMIGLKSYGNDMKNSVSTVTGILDAGWSGLKQTSAEIVGGWSYVLGKSSSQDVDQVVADVVNDSGGKPITNAVMTVVNNVEDTKENILNIGLDTTGEIATAGVDVVKGDMSVLEFYNKTNATISNAGVSTVEGIANWGEKVYDTIDLKSNYYFGKVDVALGIVSQEQYDQTMAIVEKRVSDEQTKYIFDWVYEDTDAGKAISENSFASAEVRTAGNLTGEVGMNIGMAYVGGELVGASSAVSELGVSSKTAASVGSKFFAASSAGATGFSDTANKALIEGASTDQAMVAGEIGGAWRAGQYVIGSKINEFNPFSNTASNAVLHVGLDTIDGGTEGFVQPLIGLTYKDGIYDTNGNYIKFSETETFADKYSKAFTESGGWTNVINQAKMGAIFSAGSEAVGAAKYFRYGEDGVNKNAITSAENTKVTDVDVDIDAKNAVDEITTVENTKVNVNAENEVIVNSATRNIDDAATTTADVDTNLTKTGESGVNISQSKVTQADLDQYNTLLDYKNTELYAVTRAGIEKWKNLGKSEIEIDTEIKRLLAIKQTNIDSYDTYVNVEKNFNSLQTKIFSEYKTDSSTLAANNSKIIANGTDDYFSKCNQYGANQADIKNSYYYRNKNTGQFITERYAKNNFNSYNVDKINTGTYTKLHNKLNDMGFTHKQADSILMSIDNTGCCSYAAVENVIINAYKNSETAFKNDFGFDLYTVFQGEKKINSAELLLDMYTYMNDSSNGGAFFNKADILDYSIDQKGIYNESLLDTSKQQYMYNGDNENPLVNKYFQSKNSNINVENNMVDTTLGNGSRYLYNKSSKNITEVKATSNAVAENINNGNGCVMNVYKNDYSEIRFINLDDNNRVVSTSNWNEDAGHSVAITAVSDDGYIVTSWGQRWLIPFEDLADGGAYNIISKNVTGIGSGE